MQEQEQLVERQQQLISDYRAQLTRYKRQAQIEKEANDKVQQELLELRNRLAEYQKENELIRSLVSERRLTIDIKDFQLTYLKAIQAYHYKFTLVQLLENAAVTKGELSIVIVGKQGDEQKLLDRSMFSPDKQASISLSFRHYQKVSGEILLPDDFSPDFIRIEVRSKGKKGVKKVQKELVWPPEIHGFEAPQ